MISYMSGKLKCIATTPISCSLSIGHIRRSRLIQAWFVFKNGKIFVAFSCFIM